MERMHSGSEVLWCYVKIKDLKVTLIPQLCYTPIASFPLTKSNLKSDSVQSYICLYVNRPLGDRTTILIDVPSTGFFPSKNVDQNFSFVQLVRFFHLF